MRILILIAIVFISLTGIAQSMGKSLTIEFDGIKEEKGTKVYVALYQTEDSFLRKPLKGTISEITNGKAVSTFTDLTPGVYAVSAFYDKNANGKLDTNFLGIPKEPTAVSNNPKARMGPPRYKDAKFELNEDVTITINF